MHAQGRRPPPPAAPLEPLHDRARRELLAHPIVVHNAYTSWFRAGLASRAELRHFAVQFSVFSNQFLVAQLAKMIHAESLQSMRAAKEILANEIGVVFHDPRRPGAAARGDRATARGTRTAADIDREGDPELVATRGSVDGGTFHFRAAHFEWLLRFGAALGLGFRELGRRRHATPATRFFCDELLRLYGSEEWNVAAGASFAIENWAAAGFWQELEDGLTIVQRRLPEVPLAFFAWHNRVEAQHADHTHAELAELQAHPDFDPELFLAGGRQLLDGLAVFWNGLDHDRRLGSTLFGTPLA